MFRVASFSVLLTLGLVMSQVLDVRSVRPLLTALTLVALGYIMIQVGLEFALDKSRPGSYARDYLVASLAATVPWLLCSAYLMLVLGTNWREGLLVARFAAPTSAGVLLSLMSAAGLGSTWVFGRARILAVFDDVDTVFFMVPFQILLMGADWACVSIVVVITALLVLAYRFLHTLWIPSTHLWLVAYGVLVYATTQLVEHANLVHHLEVLVPAFALGCLIRRAQPDAVAGMDSSQGERKSESGRLDFAVKATFMLLVGLSLRPIDFSALSPVSALAHTAVLFSLGLLGKLVPLFFYSGEVSLRTRLALCVAMFPRGEVGAGVLIIALGHGFAGLPATLGALSLTANMAATGLFVYIVKRMVDAGDGVVSPRGVHAS